MSNTEKGSISLKFSKLPWYRKLKALQAMEGWNQSEAGEHYGVHDRQVYVWNKGVCLPQRNNRRAIAKAHGLEVSDIFPAEVLKPGEISKGV